MTEDEMVERYHRLDGHESEQAPGVGDEQGRLACCSPWVCKELDMTARLNWTVVMHVERRQKGFICLKHKGGKELMRLEK